MSTPPATPNTPAPSGPASAAHRRRQQRLQDLVAAALRAQAGDARLHFRGLQLYRGAERLPLDPPHLRADPATDSLDSLRGAADGLALRLRHSQRPLHLASRPEAPWPRLVFELLEQYRVESLAPWPGVRHNLRQRHQAWCAGLHAQRLTDSAAGLLLYTVAQVCRARLTGDAPPADTEDLMEATRFALLSPHGQALADLRRQRHDQAAFARTARALALQLGSLADGLASADTGASPRGGAPRPAAPSPWNLWPDAPDNADAADSGPGSAGLAHPLASAVRAQPAYRVYSRAYDRTVPAAALVRPAQLQAQRAGLDAAVARQLLNLPRLAQALRHLLLPLTDADWQGDQEDGVVDGRRLAGLIAQPQAQRVFQRRQHSPQPDAVLGVLVDCSGSMKAHAEPLAVVLDVLLRALDQAGVASELLGFSTGAWHGGRARRDWQRAGSPPQPGRLNELLQLVFKPARLGWRQARHGVAALLTPELFREGIDGEAVDWACQRLLQHPASRRWLLVVSDGCPMDGATQAANGDALLSQHLHSVLARHQAGGQVQVLGLGVGLDLSRWYRHSRVVDLAGPAAGVLREVLDLLATRGAAGGPAWGR